MVRSQLSQVLLNSGVDVSDETFELMAIGITWFMVMYRVTFVEAITYIYGG